MASLALPSSFKAAPERNQACSLAHLEMFRNPIFLSPLFQASNWFFDSGPEGHLNTHHSEPGPGAQWERILLDVGGLWCIWTSTCK